MYECVEMYDVYVEGKTKCSIAMNVKELRPSCLNHLFIEFGPDGLYYIGCRTATTQHSYTVSLLVIILQVISVPWMAKGLAIGVSEFVGARATDANDFKRSIPVRT